MIESSNKEVNMKDESIVGWLVSAVLFMSLGGSLDTCSVTLLVRKHCANYRSK